jgi:hypothetical protein
MRIQTHVKAGSSLQHNETLVRAAAKAPQGKAPGLKVKTNVKAGVFCENHNETLTRAAGQGKAPRGKAPGLKVKTHVKAGGLDQHNETLVRAAGQGKARRGRPRA